MPDFSLSIQDSAGTVWCWDKKARKVLKIAAETREDSEVPPGVLVELLKKALEQKEEN